MYSAMCLSLLDDICFVEIGYPITIPGVCPDSTSAASAKHQHIGQLKDAPHFIGNEGYVWDIRIPEYYSVETIWAETMLKGIRAMKKDALIDTYFSEKRLIEQMFTNNIDNREQMLQSFTKNQQKLIPSKIKEDDIGQKMIAVKGKIYSLSRYLMKKRLRYDNVQDIEEAVKIVETYLNQLNDSDLWKWSV